jgi:tetratricopeptide (TPR) repeat protein
MLKKEYEQLISDIRSWHEAEDHEKILRAVESLPRENWDYQLSCLYARALNNLERYSEALDLLLGLEEEGREDGFWHYRVGYSLYFLNREEEAVEQFQKAIEFGDDCGDTREFLEASRREAELKREQAQYNPEVYTQEEMACIEKHISRYFGKNRNVFHELVSPDIHVDIVIIEPVPERNYYVLVTMGMGAHRMNVPEDLKRWDVERAEILVCLPPDWDFRDLDKEEWYWPMQWLKIMARFPGEQNTWLGWGHTVPNGRPFADNTRFTTMLLLNPAAFGKDSFKCRMPDGSAVNFYQMVPLFEEEARFKINNNTELLLNFLDPKSLELVDNSRENRFRT